MCNFVANSNIIIEMKRILIWTLSVIAVLYLLAESAIPALVMHSFMDEQVTYRQTYKAEEVGLPAPDTLHLIAEDGMGLVAYALSPESPKAVVICLTGIQNPSVTCYWGHARMFYDAGYASILLEVRGHAPSEGNRICAGYQETRDVQAVTDYIKHNPELRETPIVVMGISMGGAIAINSIGNNDDIDALVSISAYSAFEDVFVELMDGQIPALFTWCIKPFVRLTALVKFGANPWTMRPKSAITRLHGRPALLMHTTKDLDVPYANFERIMAKAPDNTLTLVRDVDEHFFTPDFFAPQTDTLYCNALMDFIASTTRSAHDNEHLH